MQKTTVRIKISPTETRRWIGIELEEEIYYNTTEEFDAKVNELYARGRKAVKYQMEIGTKVN